MKFTFKNLSRKQYIWIGIGAVVIVVIAMVASGDGNGDGEVLIVERRDIIEEVAVSGRVEAGSVSDLGFEVSGKVLSIGVSEGDTVPPGALLVSLDLGTLSAELVSAEADVLIKEAEAANAQTNLDDVIAQQDTLVESAYSTLLSDNLEAYASSDSVTATKPVITGRYTGPEGQYKVIVARGATTYDFELRVFGIESVTDVDIEDTTVTPLGTHGLFISFPDGVSAYEDTTWFVDIPNIDGASYTENLNAYEEALRARDVAIEAAQADVIVQESGASIVQAELASAQAEVLRIQAEIAKRRLVAPFSGIITGVEVDPGEIVSANTIAVSIISDDGFGVEIDLPEIDSVKVQVDDPVVVTLDAFGDDVVFDAYVASVNRTETIVDNVAVYEARLLFNEEDARIASGMTADVVITTDTRENVLAVPARALRFREDGTPFVFVVRDGVEEEIDVALGLRGSDGFIEIQAGLSEGDNIFIPEN